MQITIDISEEQITEMVTKVAMDRMHSAIINEANNSFYWSKRGDKGVSEVFKSVLESDELAQIVRAAILAEIKSRIDEVVKRKLPFYSGKAVNEQVERLISLLEQTLVRQE